MIVEETEIPIYDILFTIMDVSSYKKANKFFKKQGLNHLSEIGIDDNYGLYASIHTGLRKVKNHRHHCIYAVFNSRLKGDKLNHGVLVHESIHVADEVYRLIRAEHNPENSEFRAYLVEYIFNVMANFLKKNKIKV